MNTSQKTLLQNIQLKIETLDGLTKRQCMAPETAGFSTEIEAMQWTEHKEKEVIDLSLEGLS